MARHAERWIAPRSLSSGAHSRDPLARNNVEILKRHTTVMPREGGTSNTPQLLDSITVVSGILDHPPSRTISIA